MVAFGLRPEEVWKLTAAQYAAMSAAHHEQRKFLDLQFAWTRLLCIAPHVDPKKSKPKMKDFVLFPDSLDMTKRDQTPEQQLSYVQNFLVPYFEALHEAELKKEERNN